MSDVIRFQGALIHDAACFNLETLRSRAELLGFTQVTEVEAFAWELELYGQLQAVAGETLLLKGGAAAQLYLPPERQRASADIDLLVNAGPGKMHAVLDQVSRRLAGESPYFVFEEYAPRQPDACPEQSRRVILPLETFFVTVPSALGQTAQTGRGRVAGRSIKVDVFYLRESLPATRLENPRTFALDLAYSPRCLAVGPLVGDKLLTLATRSIGIPRVRTGDLPRQLYDLDNLTRLALDEEDIQALIATMRLLVEVESGLRGLQVTPLEVLDHIRETLDTLSALDLRQGDPDLKRYVLNAQSQYLRAPMRAPFHGWAMKALRLRFLLHCLVGRMRGHRPNVAETLHRADELEAEMAFEGLEGRERRSRRKAVQAVLLAALRDAGKGDWKQLKPRPPERVYWALVEPGNLDSVAHLIAG